jgi:hypothetical protein
MRSVNGQFGKLHICFGKMIFYLFTLLPFYLFTSCTQDAYEKGEGDYSLMRGDFAEANVNSNREITSIITDEGETLPLTTLQTAQWISRPDTIYRCMLYYNKVKGSDGKPAAEVISLGKVLCLYIKPLTIFEKTYKDDPVKFESLWRSKSGKYLNLHLQLKTGYTEDSTAVQKLDVVSDTLITYPGGQRTLSVLLYHDQANVPEYYSTQAYVSIPTTDLTVDSIRLYLNTYSGPVVKTLPLQ